MRRDYSRRTVTERFMDLSFIAQVTIIVAVIASFTLAFRATQPDESFNCNADNVATVIVTRERNATLWEIANRYCTGSIESATRAMVKTYGTDLREGQIIRLPRG